MNGDRSERLAWFDELYRNAGADAENVPWARLEPHPGLVHWAGKAATRSGNAIDIGCGLGDNAEYLADLGYRTTAFDLSKTAIDWAKRRFPESSVTYRTADLFELPADWTRSFDLVSEVYTLQALPEDIRSRALAKIANLANQDGRVVVVCMARDEDEQVDGPPWSLARSEIDAFLRHGFETEFFDDLKLGESERRHFVAVYRRV